MSDHRLPWVERVLAALFLRGGEADVVVGDIVERCAEDLAEGGSSTQARKRLRRQVIVSCWEWWRPGVVGERFSADPSGHTGARGFKRKSPRIGIRGTGRGMGMGHWMKDLKVSARSLRRRPGFTLTSLIRFRDPSVEGQERRQLGVRGPFRPRSEVLPVEGVD